MYILILYFPLVGSLWALLWGRFLGKNGSIFIILLSMFVALLISLFIFFEVVLSNNVCVVRLFKWIDVGYLNVYWEFLYDALTSIMLLVIIGISFCVHLYSIEYMYYDPHLSRFLSYLSLFTFFMLILVTAGNFLQLFIGWEGVGFCSYLLINFWYTRIVANKAAMKALIINKIGDISLLLGIIIFFILYYSLDFSFINCISWLVKKTIYLDTYIFFINIDYLSIVLFLFIIGACAKSAQIGLHTWLPDAMEGPTPVSALIHAATMVTAGVFLLLRIVHLLKYDEYSLLLISFVGGITSFVAATIGLFQNDIKKIIAYSTCSQLGYMILSCGLSNYIGSLFHLMNHAFFKALLFLSAGAIIHSVLDQQDIRRMGMFLKNLPVSYIMILIGSLTIMGIPFLTGFYSKDFILEYLYSSKISLNFFLYWLGIIAAVLTSFYSIKLLFLTFYNVHNSYFGVIYEITYIEIKEIYMKFRVIKLVSQESKILILISLVILFLGSVFIGFLFKDLFVGMGTDIWINTLDTESYKDKLKLLDVEFIPIDIKLIPLFFTLFSAFFSFLFFKYYLILINLVFKYYMFIKISFKLKIVNFFEYKNYIFFLLDIRKFFSNAYYFNEIYNFYLYYYRNVSNKLFKNLDKGLIEFLYPLSIVWVISYLLNFFSKKSRIKIDSIVFIIIYGIYSLCLIIVILNSLYNYKILCILVFILIIELIKFLNNKNKD